MMKLVIHEEELITYNKKINTRHLFSKSQNVHILASMHLITLVIEVGELGSSSKVKGDFLLKAPEDKMQM